MTYLLAAAISFVITFLLVPLNRKLSLRLGINDYPRERSVHQEVVPKSGGLSLWLGILLSQIILTLSGIQEFDSLFIGLVIGGTLILILGLLDDIFDLTPWTKIIIETCIVLLIIPFGFKIDLLTNPFNEAFHLGWGSIPFTILWFLLVMNAINLIDGLDGLATGIVMIVSLVVGFASIICSHTLVAYFLFSIFGACIAFLRYNFYPASIFLGDAGSLYLGFMLAALSIAGNRQFKGATAMTMLIPLICLSIPIIDALLAVFRRVRHARSIFEADKHHLHHWMLRLGFPYKTVVYSGYFLTGLFGLISLGFLLVDRRILFMLVIVLGIILIILFYNLAKKEFFR